jgi:hypothetical protein
MTSMNTGIGMDLGNKHHVAVMIDPKSGFDLPVPGGACTGCGAIFPEGDKTDMNNHKAVRLPSGGGPGPVPLPIRRNGTPPGA